VLLKLHHSVADGMAAVAIMGSLFDLQPDTPDPAPERWIPEPVPGAWLLIADNLSNKIRTLLDSLEWPIRCDSSEARLRIRVARDASEKPMPAPLNRASVRTASPACLDLGAVKQAAHAHDAKVNDVVLDLWTGGLRQLMLHHGEPTAGIELITDIPVALRRGSDARTVGNQLGFIDLPLPVREPDVQRRLGLIVATTSRAKAEQHKVAMARFLAAASAIPLAKFLTAHQHSVNVRVSNVAGPPVPVYMLGARVLEILPIMRLFGNVGLTLCAFSYAGQISLVVTADAGAFPDLDVLMGGMEREWHTLIAAHGGLADDGLKATEAARVRR
jgi:WS/DGAT/MGAT family acyltransferase